MYAWSEQAQLTICQWWACCCTGTNTAGVPLQETGLWTQAGRKHVVFYKSEYESQWYFDLNRASKEHLRF